MQIEDQYLRLLRELLDQPESSDRTGTGTRKAFGRQLRHDLSQGFPLLTTKRVWLKGVAEELQWFLSGSTSIKPLVDEDVSIWTPNAYAEYCGRTENPVSLQEFENRIRSGEAPESWSELGPVYGSQWRGFGGVDQIQELVKGLRQNPDSRRHVVSAWNPPELSQMCLPPCHFAFQCFSRELETGERELSLMWSQRSADAFLGLPFNLASYALLTHVLAEATGHVPGAVIGSLGDVHLYANHIQQAREQLSREPFELPELVLEQESVTEFSATATGYDHHPSIQAPIAT